MKTWQIIVIVASLVGFGLYVPPVREDVVQMRAENKDLENQIQELNHQLHEVDRIGREAPEKKDQLVRRIPLDNEQEKLIQDIENITLRTGFSYDGLSFSKGKNPVLGLPELKISFSTQGNKANLIRFLEALENNERFLGLETLSISTREENNVQMVSFGVALYAFYQQEGK